MGLLQTCDKDVSEVSHFEDVQQGGGLEIELGHTGESLLVGLGKPWCPPGRLGWGDGDLGVSFPSQPTLR